MDWIEYSNKAIEFRNKSLDWNETVKHGCFGLAAESGEVLSLFQKYFFQGHAIDRDKVKLELGDALWFLNLVSDSMGFDLEEIAQANITKLDKRYSKGQFSTEQSLNRKETQ